MLEKALADQARAFRVETRSAAPDEFGARRLETSLADRAREVTGPEPLFVTAARGCAEHQRSHDLGAVEGAAQRDARAHAEAADHGRPAAADQPRDVGHELLG